VRIGVNATFVDPVPSGLGVYAANLVRQLAGFHDDLLVYTSYPAVCGVGPSKIRAVTPGVRPMRGLKGHMRRLAWIQTILPLRLRRDQVSVLLCPLPEGMLLPVVPQVVIVHDLTGLHSAEHQGRGCYYRYFRHVVPRLLSRSAAIIADSESTRQDLAAHYGLGLGRVRVVPAGCDRELYRAGIDSEPMRQRYGLEEYILYVGNLMPHKNLGGLLRAFTLMMDRIPHTLAIVGRKDPRYYPELEADVAALGIAKRVTFLGHVSNDQLPALYTGAAAVVLPSFYEGFGLTSLEAMACGTPVVAANTSSIPEVVGDAGLLVDPHDTGALADAVLRILTDEALREELTARGRGQAARFSWGRTAQEVLDVLRQVAER
jgi:glycosyltransferase involved in cell wall biosynthesis